MKKLDAGTITRTILIIVALVNQGLLIAGKNPLPFEDDQIAQVISFGFVFVTSLVAWWKNNNFTKEAIEAQAYLNDLKALNKDKVITIKADNIATGTIQSETMKADLGEGNIDFIKED